MQPTSHDFKANAHRALGDAQPAARHGMMRAVSPPSARRRSRACRNSTRCATTASRHQESRAGASRFLSRNFREERRSRRAARSTGAAPRERGARHHPRHLPRRRRQDRDQGQVDGRRGDRAQRSLEKPTASRRSKPISANTSSRSATRRRATSSRPAIHLVKEQVAESFRAAHTHLPPGAPARGAARSCATRRAASARRNSSPPMSASPAPISSSRRPARSIIVTNEGNGDLTQNLTQASISCWRAREDRADPRGRGDAAAALGAFRDRAGILDLHHGLDRAAPARRYGRTGGISRRAARQWAQRDSRQRVPGHAALHPLRRVLQPLPGLWRDRRPCLWLGLCRADGRGADAATRSASRKRATCPTRRLFAGAAKSVCPMRIPLPKMMRHWREREFERHLRPRRLSRGAEGLGVYRAQPAALSLCRRYRRRRRWAGRAGRAAGFARCRWPRAGPRAATCRRPKARPS